METASQTKTGHPLVMTQDELVSLLRERFSDDPGTWAFECPSCGDIATGQDFREALAANPRTRSDGTPVTASDRLGQECIGRTLGALSVKAKDYKGRGCDWTAYGLFRGPVRIVVGDGGGDVYCFPVAPKAA